MTAIYSGTALSLDEELDDNVGMSAGYKISVAHF